ncbi:MAG: hypothetical protein ABSA16_12670 [Thermoguttaceae bacterium]
MDQSQYIEFKKQVAEGLRSSAYQFDKAILTLASGALALSLTFIKEIAPNPDHSTICIIGLSWACFIASICLTLMSFHTSICAYRRFDNIIDTICSKPNIDRSSLKNHWNCVTILLNILSLIVFIVGTVFLTYSVYHNLQLKGEKMADHKLDLSKRDFKAGAITPFAPVANRDGLVVETTNNSPAGPDSTRGAPTPSVPAAPITQPTPGTGAIPPAPPQAPPNLPTTPPPTPKK